jgi:hypothetical protein
LLFDDARLFAELPRDLEEAALVDGDSRWSVVACSAAVGGTRFSSNRCVLFDRFVE